MHGMNLEEEFGADRRSMLERVERYEPSVQGQGLLMSSFRSCRVDLCCGYIQMVGYRTFLGQSFSCSFTFAMNDLPISV